MTVTTPFVEQDLQVDELQEIEQTFETKIDQLIETVIELDLESRINEKQYQEEQQEQYLQMLEDFSAVSKTQIEGVSQVDMTETNFLLSDILFQLETLNQYTSSDSAFVQAGNASIFTYATVYIPLIVILVFGWWFFNHFLSDFR